LTDPYSSAEARMRSFTNTRGRPLDRGSFLRQQTERALRLIVKGTATVTGNDFLHALVKSLALALGTRYALVSEVVDAQATRVRTGAVGGGGGFAPNIEYATAGPPGGRVIRAGETSSPPRALRALSPADAALAAMGAESYMGIPISDSAGAILGH